MTTRSSAQVHGWRARLWRSGLLLCLMLAPRWAGATEDAGVSDGGSDADLLRVGIQPTTTPDNLGCSGAGGVPGGAAPWGGLALVALFAAGRGYRRGHGRRAGVVALAAALSQGAAVHPAAAQPRTTEYQTAAPEAATVLHDLPLYKPTGRSRHVTLTFNPLTLLLSRYGLNVEAMLTSHHVLVGTVYYAYTRTNDDSANNIFRGFGGEVGYRYYFGSHGPRGLYLGPSFLIGQFAAIPQVGDTVPYWNYGAALDLGYQYLVADRVTLGLGAGVQYTTPTQSFPAQELPASIYAVAGVRPRLLLALGVAF